MFATYMYERMGLEWASSLLAFLSILLIPVSLLDLLSIAITTRPGRIRADEGCATL